MLILLSIALGAAAIFFAVRRQYVPLERLMQHFSSADDQLQNEYQNISDYLLQAQERNEHHFMVDVLQGHVSHTDGFAWRQLLLISPQDPQGMLPLSILQEELPSCRVVPIFGQTALLPGSHTADLSGRSSRKGCGHPEPQPIL